MVAWDCGSNGVSGLTGQPVWLAGNAEMTATLPDVAAKKQAEQSAEHQAAAELVRLAKKQGSSRRLADELLKQLTKTVLETALNEEMTEHLGYENHNPGQANSPMAAT
jgi:hypothetical protein